MRVFLVLLFLNFIPAYSEAEALISEIVECAHVIGIWKTTDIKAKNFNKPVKLLKGKVTDFKNLSVLNNNLDYMVKSGKKEWMVIIGRYNNGNHWLQNLHEHTAKYVPAILKQFDEIKKWQTFTVKKQISKSTLIIQGQIRDSGEICPVSHYAEVKKALKGKSLKRIIVFPVDPKLLNKDSLIFLQLQPGSSPMYRVMNTVPVKDSQDYLKELNK